LTQEGEESIENLEDTKGIPIREWVMLRAQRKEIYNRFKNFLRTYVDSRGHNLYRKLIQDMCSLNKSSFEVSELLGKQAHSGLVLPEQVQL